MKIKFLISAFMLACVFANAQQHSPEPTCPQQSTTAQIPSSNESRNPDLTYKIIEAPNNTFCYDVYAEGRLMVHQTSSPGLSGNEGFKTKEDASKVAELVMEKIRKGEMPPTVSLDEMKQLNVIK